MTSFGLDILKLGFGGSEGFEVDVLGGNSGVFGEFEALNGFGVQMRSFDFGDLLATPSFVATPLEAISSNRLFTRPEGGRTSSLYKEGQRQRKFN